MNKLSVFSDPKTGEVTVQSESLRPVEAIEALQQASILILAAVKRTIQEDLGFGISSATGGFVDYDAGLEATGGMPEVPSYNAPLKGN